MANSQYATTAQLQLLAITPAAFARFEAASAGCTTAAIQAASSIADASLTSQFVLPLQTSPQGWDMALTMHVCAVAAWLLYNQFGYAPMAPGDDLIAKRYERALEWFDLIGKKTVNPLYIDSSGLTPGADTAGDFVITDSPVGFTQRGVTQPAGSCPPGSFWWD